MKYIKAGNILPEYLLKEIQKYAEGCVVYIPNKNGSRRAWGEKTGARAELKERNNLIKSEFKAGFLIDELAEKYYLSVETIKKIVYVR